VIDILLTQSIWVPLAAALLLHGLDVWLSLRERALYHAGARNTIFFPEQYTLSRLYKPTATLSQFWEWRYALFLVGVVISVPLAYSLFVIQRNSGWVFVFLMGGLLLYEAAECIRLGRMVTLFRAVRERQGIEGYLSIPRWLTANLFVVDLYGFGLLYAVLYLASGSLFFLGGAAACFIRAHSLRDWAIFTRWTRSRSGKA